MKTTAHLFFAVALILIGFGWWGTSTAAGRERFDEMAGMIPFGAGVAGLVCLLVAIVLYVLVWKEGSSA